MLSAGWPTTLGVLRCAHKSACKAGLSGDIVVAGGGSWDSANSRLLLLPAVGWALSGTATSPPHVAVEVAGPQD